MRGKGTEFAKRYIMKEIVIEQGSRKNFRLWKETTREKEAERTGERKQMFRGRMGRLFIFNFLPKRGQSLLLDNFGIGKIF